MSTAAVIVAAGSGLRAGGERPKQYQLISRKPVLWWTLNAFAAHPGVDYVIPVIGETHAEMFAEASHGISTLPPMTGGATRQDSCRLGLEALAAHKPDKVLIHDAARPFVSSELISHVIAALAFHEAVIPALPVAETLKYAPGGFIKATVDRSALYAAQTPQGFHFERILAAHRKAFEAGKGNLTDDAAVAELAGMSVAVIAGRHENRKLTTAADVEQADRAFDRQRLRELTDIVAGQGVDVHAFEPGDHVTLCGVDIPHTAKLKGHSDADAPMHALTDAILGAIGEGDIGTHFPPTDPKWKGAPSHIFVEKAVLLVGKRGGRIAHADITILCETPRIAPHIPAMKAILAPLLGLAPNRIAIKATTTEGLGFIGRQEGIAAFAMVTVRLPEAWP
jgi:2-C-methyl-D-erythritol 4-phosphate cytidylyltransferase/2-C-methyl-D-erythritol 2,4-cyclodiphosphate synthase